MKTALTKVSHTINLMEYDNTKMEIETNESEKNMIGANDIFF